MKNNSSNKVESEKQIKLEHSIHDLSGVSLDSIKLNSSCKRKKEMQSWRTSNIDKTLFLEDRYLSHGTSDSLEASPDFDKITNEKILKITELKTLIHHLEMTIILNRRLNDPEFKLAKKNMVNDAIFKTAFANLSKKLEKSKRVYSNKNVELKLQKEEIFEISGVKDLELANLEKILIKESLAFSDTKKELISKSKRNLFQRLFS